MNQNLLSRETSPYLLQHKQNPVHWRAWGPEALAEAKRLNRPILLSVGYAACHWCHVMAHESFEDDSTASVMNALFVNIKVDREERPDIDLIYQSALALMGEQGGWPLTMFLTPEGEPFWGGTYFPNQPRYGRPAFADVLRRVAEVHARDADAIRHNVAALRDGLARLAQFNCRSMTHSPFHVGFFSNAWLWSGVGLMIALQLLFTYAPVMNRLFASAPIGLDDWARIVTVGLVIYFIIEAEKAWRRRG